MSAASRRSALRAMGSLALLIGPRHLVHAAALPTVPTVPTIVAVRTWPAQEYTRVTIESDTALTASHLMVDGPDRLVVDIDGLELKAALRELVGKVRPDDPYIAGVRVGQYQPRVVRLVFDLKQPVRPEQFTLQPVAAYKHRLVFDLYPVVEADPLLTLIRDRESAEQRAVQAVQDALGELIARIDIDAATAAGAVGAVGPAASAAGGAASAPGTTRNTVIAALPPRRAAQPVPQVPVPRPTKPARPPAPTAAEREAVDRLVIVALDAGHGGEDPGAIGPTGLREKDVTLAIALKLRDRIDAMPNMRAMLTRDGDFFVPLGERVRKARRVQADLFVSIHADAFMRPQARGASVFVLSNKGASSAAARWMAARENSSDQVGGVNVAEVDDVHLLRAMLDMSTTAQIKDSLRLGHEVLTRIGRVGRLHKREVEQAGFAVLKAPDIPSILVETAFISNPEEESLLRDDAYRERLVDALGTGIQRYFAQSPPLARQRQL